MEQRVFEFCRRPPRGISGSLTLITIREHNRRYFELDDPRSVNPIGLELKLEAEFGPVRLRGVIDRLDLDTDGELVVTDYKTGTVPSEYHEAKSLSGVHIYAMLCERMLGRRPARIQL